MSGSPARVDVIDGLRACAILGVVSLHLLGIAGFLEAGTTKSLLAADRSSGRGPQTAMEAALADRGQLLPTDRDVYSLGVARMPVRLNQIGPGPPALLDPLPTPSDQQYARLAARDAGTGKLFIVAPAGDTFAQQSAPGGGARGFHERAGIPMPLSRDPGIPRPLHLRACGSRARVRPVRDEVLS